MEDCGSSRKRDAKLISGCPCSRLIPFCSPDDIKQAFRQQVALSHPDKVSHLAREIQELAFQRTMELTEAYRILSNGELRSDYDRRLQYSVKSMVPTSGSTKASKNEELSGSLKNVNSFAALIPNGAPDSLRAVIRALQ
jgi:DnaJ-class molecular chaperone